MSNLQDPGLETDVHGVDRVPYREQGWNFWNWQKHRIHYVQAGKLATLSFFFGTCFSSAMLKWDACLHQLA